MLATLSGDLCLLFGLSLLLLPLLAVELSRPRDGAWGAVVLLLGLVLITSGDRFRGAPMLAVLCGSLLISRLCAEVGQARWNALDDEEKQKLGSAEHWVLGLQKLGSAAGSLSSGIGGMAKQLKPAGRSGVSGKKWVRPEPAIKPDAEASAESGAAEDASPGSAPPASTVAADASEPDNTLPRNAEPETEREPEPETSAPPVDEV